jgi:uncharacterized protein YgbK (DUF1537 family)
MQMVELLVLADDFTGAIDTGVQFAQQSIPTLVSNRFQHLDQGAVEDFSVFVLDIESRHIPPKEAETRVIETVELALHNGIRSFYKKTDSTLRGNIGSELSALLQASGASVLAFIPAYPKNGRTTVAGTQFVNGVLLHRSIYSKDLQNPVRTSYIPDIIAAQTPIPVQVVEHVESIRFEWHSATGKRIIVFDARTDEDLKSIANHLKRLGFLQVSAGCAGFAEYLPEMLCLKRGVVCAIDCPTQLLVVCGSINPVSLKQIEVAMQGGVERIVLQPEQLLRTSGLLERSGEILIERVQQALSTGSDLILQTAQGIEDIHRFHAYCRERAVDLKAIPQLVARAVGELVDSILHFHGRLTPVVFGGDTAAGIIEALRLPKVLPIAQVAKGVVLSRLIDDFLDIPLITKAGGFGSPTIIREIKEFIS